MKIKVFIEQTGKPNEKNVFDKKTGKLLDTIKIPLTYPYPYGYILDTKAPDDENLDCYVISDKNLATGDVVDCEPIGMVEWFENGEADHKVLVKFKGEQIEADNIIKRKITDFANQFISTRSDKQYKLGKFYSRDEAEALVVASCIDS